MTALCHHCRRTRATRPRGLCWTCYYAPGVRELYPALTPEQSGSLGGRALAATYPPKTKPAPVPGKGVWAVVVDVQSRFSGTLPAVLAETRERPEADLVARDAAETYGHARIEWWPDSGNAGESCRNAAVVCEVTRGGVTA